MRPANSVSILIFIVLFAIGAGFAYAMVSPSSYTASLWTGFGGFVIAWFASAAVKIANPWEKAVILRLGHFRSLKGPGLFFIVPIIDTIPYWIDTRVITTSF